MRCGIYRTRKSCSSNTFDGRTEKKNKPRTERTNCLANSHSSSSSRSWSSSSTNKTRWQVTTYRRMPMRANASHSDRKTQTTNSNLNPHTRKAVSHCKYDCCRLFPTTVKLEMLQLGFIIVYLCAHMRKQSDSVIFDSWSHTSNTVDVVIGARVELFINDQ